jgi:adenylate cyclase
MMGLIDRALALNPSFARGWTYSGLLSLFAWQPERAIEHAEAALRLSPRARVGTTLGVIGTAHLVSRSFEEALPKLLLAIQEAPNFPVPYRWLASCYAHMGRLEEARDVVRRLRAITPIAVPPATQFRDPEQRELLLSGLRLAAGEA